MARLDIANNTTKISGDRRSMTSSFGFGFGIGRPNGRTAIVSACLLAGAGMLLAPAASAKTVKHHHPRAAHKKVAAKSHYSALVPPMTPPPSDYGTPFELSLGKTRVVEIGGAYDSLAVGDPSIADVLPLTTHSVYVVGKSLGATTLSVYGANKRPISILNVTVGPDVESLKARIHELFPAERDITARMANTSVVLSGTVSSPETLAQVLMLAQTYASVSSSSSTSGSSGGNSSSGTGGVVNLLGVQGTQQVMLSVRFVEMSRSAAKNFNITTSGTQNGNPTFFGTSGPSKNINSTKPAFTPYLVPTTAYGAAGMIINGNLGLEIDAAESKGMVRTLAEPTLTAMSGDTASFLAGGEYPVPVVQAGSGATGNAITIQFRQFGVSLAFTPTILRDGLINLVVKPEVSSIDTASSVSIGGTTVPGLKTRRASTTVELRDGETFMIAGLLSDDYQNTINAFPFLGDIPILGDLFHSTGFKHDQTELVIIVTPHLAVPRRGPVALPTDHFVPPSDRELFLFGRQNGDVGALTPADRALMSKDPKKGGVEGPYGHVVY